MTTQAGAMGPEGGIEADRFAEIWHGNDMSNHPAAEAGIAAIDSYVRATPEQSTLYITDVTLRDGQQQQMNEVTVQDRIEVFDEIVSTGVDRIEIGHLGNKNGDQELAAALVGHIAEREQTDELYRDVKLQVLFGSQEDLIQDGAAVLQEAFKEHYPDSWQEEMARRVVVHVYDRVDPALVATASEPYDNEESAKRVCTAAAHAQNAGFKHFSISGEATTAIDPDSAAQFYRTTVEQLVENGAETVNVNLPNTYGYSINSDWNTATMAAFNAAVKYGFDEKVTTSIHPHNDVDNAVSFTMAAIAAGFDRVEGTLIGVGERTGNVATIDVLARVFEHARHQKLQEQRAQRMSCFAQHAGKMTMQRTVKIDKRIIDRSEQWYPAAENIAEIFGPHARYRWHRTAVGNPYAHDNGSGPHDQALAKAVIDPLNHPADTNYEWALLTNGILGRPKTEDIAVGDPEAVKSVTVNNHAAGGKTWAIMHGELERPPAHVVEQAREEFRQRKQAVKDIATKGVVIVSG
jgi:isopropylmalate/homocitrate/citramalate synthase